MEVVVAKSAGFCFGVKRAVDAVYEQLETGKTIYTYGPIVHNEEVVKALEEQGVRVIENEEELRRMEQESLCSEKSTVIVRAHGIPQTTYKLIKEKGLECIDATCPFVGHIHQLINGESAKGRHIIIIGNEQHPEVIGIKGWAAGPVTVIETREQAENFQAKKDEKLYIVSQTTFNYKKFKDLVEILDKKRYDKIVVNTICNATEERQTEARQIAGEVDAMIVIGGSHSSNTQKLFEICRNECENTYYIQTVCDLDLEVLRSTGLVGITAGASTPKKIIEEVQTRCLN